MRPAWTALCPIQPPDVADAGGDEAAVGAKGETAWVDHAFCRKDEAVCKMRPNDNDIQVSGGSAFLCKYRINNAPAYKLRRVRCQPAP